jgi:hypothetical protein
MKKFSKALKFVSPFLVSASCAISLPAAAAQPTPSMLMSIYLTVTETLVPTDSDPGRCPPESYAMAIGMVTGSGTMHIATGPGPKIITIPVMFAGSDCPTPAFQFSSGRFTLSTPSGHHLFADYYGGFYTNPDNPAALLLDPNRSVFVIAGGTGILEGASGKGALVGNEDILRQSPSFVGFGNMQAHGAISFSNPGFAQRFINGK